MSSTLSLGLATKLPRYYHVLSVELRADVIDFLCFRGIRRWDANLWLCTVILGFVNGEHKRGSGPVGLDRFQGASFFHSLCDTKVWHQWVSVSCPPR